MPDVVACPSCGQRNRVPADAIGKPQCGKCHAALPWVADATDATFGAVVEASPLPVILDLWAPWCGPCRMVSPALESLARELTGRVKLVKVNVDDNLRTAQRFDARSIPLLVILQKNQALARHVGAAPESVLREWLLANLPATK